jgi:RNA polymerase sigma-70 factor (ECF subfamily)
MPDVEALFREQDAHLRRTLRRRFNSAVPDVLIEDACASAWAIAWKRRDAIPEENPVGWLVVVARNELLGLLRQRRAETPAEPPASAGAPMADPELALERREAVELLNGLGVNQRVALTLRAAGFSYREIAAITGKTHTWTNRHISEGRARVRALATSGTGRL